MREPILRGMVVASTLNIILACFRIWEIHVVAHHE
jgi:hypothetical protein